MVGFEFEIPRMARCRERDVYGWRGAMFEGLEESWDAWERLAGGEVVFLSGADFGEVFFARDGELGPVEEDFAGLL